MTARNRNRNCNDPVGSVGADFNINIPTAYGESLGGSHHLDVNKEITSDFEMSVTRCVSHHLVENIETKESRFNIYDDR